MFNDTLHSYVHLSWKLAATTVICHHNIMYPYKTHDMVRNTTEQMSLSSPLHLTVMKLYQYNKSVLGGGTIFPVLSPRPYPPTIWISTVWELRPHAPTFATTAALLFTACNNLQEFWLQWGAILFEVFKPTRPHYGCNYGYNQLKQVWHKLKKLKYLRSIENSLIKTNAQYNSSFTKTEFWSGNYRCSSLHLIKPTTYTI